MKETIFYKRDLLFSNERRLVATSDRTNDTDRDRERERDMGWLRLVGSLKS